MARLLGPAEFGLYSIASAIIFIGGTFADQGFSVALVQRHEVTERDFHSVFWLSLLLAGMLALLTVAVSGPLALWFDAPQLRGVIVAIAPAIPLMAASGVINASLTRNLRFKSLTVLSVLSAAGGAVLGIAMAFGGYGVWSLVGQVLAGNLLGLTGGFAITRYRPRALFDSEAIRELWRFGLWSLAGDMAGQVSQRSIPLLIGSFFGPAVVGLYGLARRLVEVLQFFVTAPIAQVAVPVMAKLQDERVRAATVARNGLQALFAIVAPLFTLVGLLGPEGLVWLLGEHWRAAAPLVPPLSVAALFGCLSWYITAVLLALGHPRKRLALQLFSFLGAVSALVILREGGISTVAWGLASISLLVALLGVGMLASVVPLAPLRLVTAIGAALPALALMVAAAAGIRSESADIHVVLRLFVASGPAVALYAAGLIFFAPRLVARILDLVPFDLPLPRFVRTRLAVAGS